MGSPRTRPPHSIPNIGTMKVGVLAVVALVRSDIRKYTGQAMAVDYDFTEEVRALAMPTMIVAGDADMCPPSHFVEVFKLLDGGLRDGGWMAEGRPAGGHALAILPGVTHYNMCVSPLFAAVTLNFLADK